MRNKDYEMVAREIKAARYDIAQSEAMTYEHKQWSEELLTAIVSRLGGAFEDENPNFDYYRFRKACQL